MILQNTGTISSASLNFILTDDFTHTSDSFSGFNNFSNLAITTEGTFTNNAAIDLAGNLTITANTFNNTGGVVDVDEFALSVAGDFDYGTITANAFNLQVGGDFSYDDSANDFVLGVNDSLTVSGSANIIAADFANSGTITVTDALNVTADTFANSGGVVSADTLALSVAGDFDYAANFLHNGTITANAYNLHIGGDFSYNDSANDFVWDANNTLTVLGDANIVAADFANSGTITVTDSLNVTANTFVNSGEVLNADTFALSVAGDFEHSVTITANTYNLRVGGDFSYNDSANNFTWGVNDSLVVLGSANIVAADFANSGIITVTNNFNATVANFTNETGATITAAECNFVHDSFIDSGTIICLDSVDTTVDNIAVPENGLSDNEYETFHIPRNGVVFNNSDSATTSQLLGNISANPNYNDGNAASIILAQVTSATGISLLLGTLEVVGAEAVVIIANPNGIEL